MAHFDTREWPTCLGLWMFTGAGSATGVLSKSSLLCMVGIGCSLATRSRRRGRGDVGNLEGSSGPRRVVQSLWSGAAAAVHRLASPRPVSGWPSRSVAMAGIMLVVVKMRPSPAGGRPKRWARRKMDMALRALLDDKTAGIGRIAVRPRTATRTPGTRR